jgi:hypothetical protein
MLMPQITFVQGEPMSAIKDKRQHPRKTLWYPAKIDCGDGSTMRDCQFRDISPNGARLLIGKGERLPDRFTLMLSAIGKSYRRCRIAWRSETETGVEFLFGP